MKNRALVLLWVIFGIFIIFGLSAFLFIIFNPIYFKWSFLLDQKLASDFGVFFGGFIGTIFSITSTLLIIITLLYQNINGQKGQAENNFFRMLNFHNDNVKNLSVKHIKIDDESISQGRRAFVIFRLQLIELIKVVEDVNITLKLQLSKDHILDIAYISFYYGIDEVWKEYLIEKLSRYDHPEEIVNQLLIHKNRIKELKKMALYNFEWVT